MTLRIRLPHYDTIGSSLESKYPPLDVFGESAPLHEEVIREMAFTPGEKLTEPIGLYDVQARYETVNHPAHYNQGKVEVIDVVEDLLFNRGNAIKYLLRAGHKPGSSELEDLRKALFYVQREIGRLENG